MGRAPCCDKANVKKGPWAPEEDAKLKRFIETNGTGGNWITLPSKAGLRRCGKSCRLRWTNYLRPDIRHGKFTDEEEKIIIYWHNKKGSRWSQIAAMLHGRTDNDIKNFWNTRLKKKLAEPVAEKWTNSSFSHQQQQYRSHMRSAPGPMFAAGVSQPEGITVSPLSIDHQTAQYPAQYLEQQCDNAAERRSQAEPFTLISPGLMQERELQWNERLRSRPIAPEAYDAEKLRNMVGELGQLCEISPDANDSVKSTRSSDILQQWSSFSPCDNWSHDAYYADSSYVDNVNLPPPLEDVPSHHVPPLGNDLPSPALFASDGRAIREEDPAFFDMRALLADVQGARLPPFDLYDAHTTSPVKEEMYTDFSTSELITSPPVRGFSSISHNQRFREATAAYRSGMRPPQQDTSFLRKWKGLIDNQYVSVPGRTR